LLDGGGCGITLGVVEVGVHVEEERLLSFEEGGTAPGDL